MKSISVRLASVVAIIYLGVACSNGGGNSNPPPTFDSNIEAAKKLLATTPTGTQAVNELNTMITNGSITGVKPIKTETKYGHTGGIHQVSDGVYEIQLKDGSSVEDLAQGLAHELVHVKNEVLEDKYLDDNKDLNDRMGAVAKQQGQDLQNFYYGHKDDVDFFYVSLMFEEVKAYQRNLQIEKEGIPFHNSEIKDKGLFSYIRASYVPSTLSVSSTDDGDKFINLVNKYDNLVDFQKALLAGKNN